MSNTLVSVITVVLNDNRHIASTIESVLSQTYQNREYIIIDGGSTDGTVDIIRKYENELSYWMSEPDKGLYDAMNKGTCLAKGEWISYMNSGDLFSSNDILNKIFSDNYNYIYNKDVIYSDVIAKMEKEFKYRKARKIRSFWRGLPFSHQSHFVKTSLAKNKLFNLEYKISADYDFLYSVYKNNASFYYFKFPISICDATKGLSKEINLFFLYKQFFKICKIYSTPLQVFLRYLILIPEVIYAIIRRYINYYKHQ